MRWLSLSNCDGNCCVVTGCKGTEVGKCGYKSYADRCEFLIIRVHMTYISVICLQTVYILVCVLCTVCILRTEGMQYAQFWKYANCYVITARGAAKVGWCWTGRETEVDRWGDCSRADLINLAYFLSLWCLRMERRQFADSPYSVADSYNV